jgi:hypothetical protein
MKRLTRFRYEVSQGETVTIRVTPIDVGPLVTATVESKTATQSLAQQLKRDSVARDTVLGYLRELEQAAPAPLRAMLRQATTELEASQRNAAAVDSSLRRSIAVQDSVLAKVARPRWLRKDGSSPGVSTRRGQPGTPQRQIDHRQAARHPSW